MEVWTEQVKYTLYERNFHKIMNSTKTYPWVTLTKFLNIEEERLHNESFHSDVFVWFTLLMINRKRLSFWSIIISNYWYYELLWFWSRKHGIYSSFKTEIFILNQNLFILNSDDHANEILPWNIKISMAYWFLALWQSRFLWSTLCLNSNMEYYT